MQDIMKNILVVVGSGMKNGNTYQLSESFVVGAKKGGHHIDLVFLGDKILIDYMLFPGMINILARKQCF